jgi:hypothetical protein
MILPLLVEVPEDDRARLSAERFDRRMAEARATSTALGHVIFCTYVVVGGIGGSCGICGDTFWVVGGPREDWSEIKGAAVAVRCRGRR